MATLFEDVIKQHLELKRRNRGLDSELPLTDYRIGEPEPLPSDALAAFLSPDGPAGWPSAEGLGLETPDDLWTGPDDVEWPS